MHEEIKQGWGEYCTLWDSIVKFIDFGDLVIVSYSALSVGEKISEPFLVITVEICI